MNLDRTFCRNEDCPAKNLCDRSAINLQRWIKTLPPDTYIRPLSMAHFTPTTKTGKCDYFNPVDEKEQVPAHD